MNPSLVSTSNVVLWVTSRPVVRACASFCCPCPFGSIWMGRHAHGDRSRFQFECVVLGLAASAAVHLVAHLAVELHVYAAGLRGAEARCPVGVAGDRAANRARPLRDTVGGDHGEVEQAVIWLGVVEDPHAPEQGTDVSGQNAACPPAEPAAPVDLDLGLERRCPEALGAGPDVGGPAQLVLEAAVCVSDHVRVKAGAGHDGEPLAVQVDNVDLPLSTRQAVCDCAVDGGGKPEVGGEQVRGAGRDDRHARPAPGERVDAPLRHAVAAPHEEVLGAVLEKPLHLLGCLAALRDLRPHRILHAMLREAAPQLWQASLDRLAGVRDHCDLLRHERRSPASSAAFEARAAASETTRVPMPTSIAAPTSVGWCMPRYMRENATSSGIAMAIAQITMRAPVFRIREVISKARPQYTATDAAVWPE